MAEFPWIVNIVEASYTLEGRRYFGTWGHGYGYGEKTIEDARSGAMQAASRGLPHWEVIRVEIRRFCDTCKATGRVKGNRKCKACGQYGSTPVETAIFRR